MNFSLADGFIYNLYIRAKVFIFVFFQMASSSITRLLDGQNEMLQVMPLAQNLAHSECSMNTGWKQNALWLNQSGVGVLEGEPHFYLYLYELEQVPSLSLSHLSHL